MVLWTSSSWALRWVSCMAQPRAMSHNEHPNQPIVWGEGGKICLEEPQALKWQEVLSFKIEKH